MHFLVVVPESVFFLSLSISSHSIYVFFSFMRTIELTLSICTTKIHAVNLNFDDIQWMFRMNECVYVCVLYIKRGPENHYSFGFCAGFSCQLWFSHSENNRTHQWLMCVCKCASLVVVAATFATAVNLYKAAHKCSAIFQKTIHWMHRFTNWCLMLL